MQGLESHGSVGLQNGFVDVFGMIEWVECSRRGVQVV